MRPLKTFVGLKVSVCNASLFHIYCVILQTIKRIRYEKGH